MALFPDRSDLQRTVLRQRGRVGTVLLGLALVGARGVLARPVAVRDRAAGSGLQHSRHGERADETRSR